MARIVVGVFFFLLRFGSTIFGQIQWNFIIFIVVTADMVTYKTQAVLYRIYVLLFRKVQQCYGVFSS